MLSVGLVRTILIPPNTIPKADVAIDGKEILVIFLVTDEPIFTKKEALDSDVANAALMARLI